MIQISRNSKRTLLGVTATLVWLAVGATFFQTVQLAARAPMTVTLTSTPSTVKISVGRRSLFDGNYQQTPAEILLPPGQHRLKISRAGFITHEIIVHGSSGQKIPIDHVLESQQDTSLETLYIDHGKPEEPFYIKLDAGLAKGMTPLSIDHLVVGKDYDMTVYPNWPDKNKASRCRVQISATRIPVEVELRRLKSGRVKFSGCRPLRKIKTGDR